MQVEAHISIEANSNKIIWKENWSIGEGEKGITNEQQQVIEENHNLIYSFLQKYNLSVDDWYGLAAIGLCKAAITYKNGVSSFSTYAYKCMFTTVWSEKRKEKQSGTIPNHQILYYQSELDNNSDGDTNCFMNYIPSETNVEDDALTEVIFEEYNSKLNGREKTIFRMFKEGYKQREIGKKVGCSQAQVSRVRKKLLQYFD